MFCIASSFCMLIFSHVLSRELIGTNTLSMTISGHRRRSYTNIIEDLLYHYSFWHLQFRKTFPILHIYRLCSHYYYIVLKYVHDFINILAYISSHSQSCHPISLQKPLSCLCVIGLLHQYTPLRMESNPRYIRPLSPLLRFYPEEQFRSTARGLA